MIKTIGSIVLASARNGAPLSVEEIIRWINYAQDGPQDEERRRIANNIFPLSGTLLSNRDVHFVITTDIAEQQIKEKLIFMNKYFERMTILLPEILRILHISDVGKAKSATHLIDDTVSNIPIVASSDHKRKQERAAINRLKRLQSSINSVTDMLSKSLYDLDIEYSFHRQALNRLFKEDTRGIDILLKDVTDLLFVIRLTLAKQDAGERPLILGRNAVKAYIVECAYTLSLWNNYPRFVTTPASDFSHLCGLLLEAATGNSAESFAGAIGKFSNSEERIEADKSYQEGERMNSDAYIIEREGNNFADIEDDLLQLDSEKRLFEKLRTCWDWDRGDKERLSLRQHDISQQMEAARARMGPFLVWADQRSLNDPRVQETENLLQASLDMDVAIGKLRRSKPTD